MAEIGWASLGIVPTFDRGFDRDLARGVDPALNRVGRDSGKRFGGILGKAAAGAAAGAIGAGFAAFQIGKGAIEQASTLNESLNAVGVTFGRNADLVKDLGENAADSLGLSNSEFNSLAVRFSAFSKTIAGSSGKRVVTTLDDLTTRASDFASVMNLEVNEAAELFQSGLAGETEPLRKFGIDLSAAAVGAHAVAVGIAESADTMTEAEKVQGRYSLLMEQTAKAEGDFANTKDEYANKQRILTANWKDAQGVLGMGLLPIMTEAATFLNDEGVPAFEDFSEWFTTKGIPAIGDFADKAKPLANEILPALGTTLDVVKGALEVAAPLAKDLVGAFNDMPDWAKTAIVGGGLGALALNKALPNKPGGGAGGGLLGLVTKAKPLPVFVVNNGVGIPGAGGDGKHKGKGKGGLPFVAGLTPYTLPLALGGDSAPVDRSAMEKAYLKLVDLEGEADNDGFFSDGDHAQKTLDNLLSASREKIAEYRKMLKEEFGVGFNQLEKEGFLPKGFKDDLRAERDAERTARLEAKITTPGFDEAFAKYKAFHDTQLLIDKPIQATVELKGVAEARRILAELAAQVGPTIGTIITGGGPRPAPGPAPEPAVAPRVQVNYNAPVTYTDEREGRKRAQQRDRRAQLDGVRMP